MHFRKFEPLKISHSDEGKEWIVETKYYSLAFCSIKCNTNEN